MSDIPAKFVASPMPQGLSGVLHDPDYLLPSVIQPYREASVGISEVGRDNAWILFGLSVPRKHRKSEQFIQWGCIFDDTPMFEELDRQLDQRTTWLKRHLLGPLAIRHVGPGGEYCARLRPQRSAALQMAMLKAATNPDYEIPKELLNLPRKLALGIWNA